MSLIETLSQPVWQKLGWTLIHFLWQGAAIAALVGCGDRLMGIRRGNPRYALYLAGFLLMAACPLVTFVSTDMPSGAPIERFGLGQSSTLRAVDDGVAGAKALRAPAEDVQDWGTAALSPSHPTPWIQTIKGKIQPVLPYLLTAWLLGVALLSLRLMLGFAALHRLRRITSPLPLELAERIRPLVKQYGHRLFKGVFASDAVREPLALGLIRPAVLIPLSMITELPPQALEAIIAHELAHIHGYQPSPSSGRNAINCPNGADVVSQGWSAAEPWNE